MDKFYQRKQYIVRATICALASLLVISAASAKPCSATDADAAQSAVDSIDSWSTLAKAHQRFAHCDIASVAEGNSEAVARLLVDQWEQLPTLAALTAKQPGFMPFVLRHIDTTLDTADIERIAELASSRCPVGHTKLCASLSAASTRALAH